MEDRSQRRVSTPTACLLAGLLLAGCASGPSGGGSVLEDSVELTPHHGFYELNLRGDAKERLHYNWTTRPNGSVDFDIHYHESFQVHYVERGTFSGREGEAVMPATGALSLSWVNRNPDAVRVFFRVQGDVTKDAGS